MTGAWCDDHNQLRVRCDHDADLAAAEVGLSLLRSRRAARAAERRRRLDLYYRQLAKAVPYRPAGKRRRSW